MGLPDHHPRIAPGHGRCTSRTLSVILATTMLALCVLSPAVPALADGNIDIDYEPDYLVMDPDSGQIHFEATNLGPDPVEVAFSFHPSGDPSDLRSRFSTVNHVLHPARTVETDLTVWRDDLIVGVRDDRFTVRVVWGDDLDFLPNGSAVPATVEETWEVTFEVLDEYPDPYGPVPFCILGIIIAGLAAVLLYPGWVVTRRELLGPKRDPDR